MAKKKPAVSPAQTASPSQKPRICFERILPDEVDPGHVIRRAMRRSLAEFDGGSLNAADVQRRTRMAYVPMPGSLEKGCRRD